MTCSNENYTLKDVIRARDKCAALIAKYGADYLPIFERIQIEVKKMENKQALLYEALDIHSKNATPNATLFATPEE